MTAAAAAAYREGLNCEDTILVTWLRLHITMLSGWKICGRPLRPTDRNFLIKDYQPTSLVGGLAGSNQYTFSVSFLGILEVWHKSSRRHADINLNTNCSSWVLSKKVVASMSASSFMSESRYMVALALPAFQDLCLKASPRRSTLRLHQDRSHWLCRAKTSTSTFRSRSCS